MLKLIKNPKLDYWHGHNSVSSSYVGDGLILKAEYGQYSDRSGHYVSGFSLYYYGELVTTYPIPKSCKYGNQEYGIHVIARYINKQLRNKV